MSRICEVTGKKPMSGNNVSHAKNRTRRRFLPNLRMHRFWLETKKKWVSLRVSRKGLRIIEKKGIDILIDSFPKICKQIENVSLLIVGPDNENYISKLKYNLSLISQEIRAKIIFDKAIPRYLLKSYCSK